MAVGLGLAAATLAGCGPATPKITVTDPANPEFYTQNVQPILQSNCYRCHGWMNHRGELNLQTRAAMLKGGKNGPALLPGDPAESLLVRLIRHEGPADHPMPMPSKSAKLSDKDIATIERWVKAGALMPETPVW
jgi:mono/diheme cytochrome c family protein